MNEIIKELAGQADEECANIELNFAWEWEKKFAELIINRCINILDTNEEYVGSALLMEHFGVKDE